VGSQKRCKTLQVAGMNEFNLKICESRATKFFQGVERIYDILAPYRNLAE
jgi:hypothetical protein